MTKVHKPKTTGRDSRLVEPAYIFLAALRQFGSRRPAYACFQGGVPPWESIEEVDRGDRIELCWRGLVDIAKHIPKGSSAMVFSNEVKFCHQFSDKLPVETRKQGELKADASDLMKLRNVKICVSFIPPTWNLAWQLLKPLLNRY